MYNTAMSALGKALRPQEAEALFADMPAPDAVRPRACLQCLVLAPASHSSTHAAALTAGWPAGAVDAAGRSAGCRAWVPGRACAKAAAPLTVPSPATPLPTPQVSFETLIAAYGMSGMADKAEAAFERMRAAGGGGHLHVLLQCVACAASVCVGAPWDPAPRRLTPPLPLLPPAGFAPRDYAYCGLIAAHSFKGDWAAALRVRERMRAAGVTPTVHVSRRLAAL